MLNTGYILQHLRKLFIFARNAHYRKKCGKFQHILTRYPRRCDGRSTKQYKKEWWPNTVYFLYTSQDCSPRGGYLRCPNSKCANHIICSATPCPSYSGQARHCESGSCRSLFPYETCCDGILFPCLLQACSCIAKLDISPDSKANDVAMIRVCAIATRR